MAGARIYRRWLAPIGIGLAAWGVFAIPYLNGWFDPFDLKLLDAKFQLRGERAASPAIAIVGIDDATIEAYRGWPFDRDTYALAIDALLQGGATAIGVDLRLPHDQAQKSSEELARISAETKRVVHVLWTPSQAVEEKAQAGGGVEFSLSRFGVFCAGERFPEFSQIEVPYPLLLQSMRRAGAAMLTEDRDGAYRRIPPFVGRGGRCLPTLALALEGASRGDSILALSRDQNRIEVHWVGGTTTSIPVDRQWSTWIDFAGSESAFAQTPMLTLLHWYQEQDLPKLRHAFAGKTVLIGLTARQQASEIGATPFDSSIPLVYVHANLLDDFIRGRFLQRVGGAGYLALLLLLSVGAAFAVTARGLAASTVIACGTTIAVVAAVQGAFALKAIEIPTVMAAGTVPLVFGLSAGYRVLFLERAGRAREAEIRKGFILQESFLPDALLRKQIAGYRIDERLGGGGMGLVFRGTAIGSGRTVAVKLLPGAEEAPETLRRRFRHEALALARLSHTNVARMIDHGTRNGIDFLVMEYVRGMSLAERIHEGRVPEEEAIAIGIQICAGLAASHDRGILHRDLKPANVMLSGRGHVKLVDFGIAQFADAGTSVPTLTPLTATGHVVGTPAYMAPEVINGREADRRTDIYGVGMILYEIVTGRWPYPPCSAQQLFWTIANEQPMWPEDLGANVSRSFGSLIIRCLSKSPDTRPSSAAELGAALVELSRPRVNA